MSLPVVILVLVAGCFFFLLFSLKDKKRAVWVQFFAKGKDEGFSLKEIELLRQLAVKSNLEEPTALFFSLERLDSCIRALVRTMRLSGNGVAREENDFLSKLYDYRKKVEMQKPRVKNGITNSRQISEGQTLRVLVRGTGVFQAQIMKNDHQNMVISIPKSEKHQLPVNFAWQGQPISIYFWRSDDAGYVFDSTVEDEAYTKGIPGLKITHSESLNRTQKRKSVRIRMHKPAFLYPIMNEEEAGRIETVPGLHCFLDDLSDTGCAVSTGGKAKANMRLKVQFVLNNVVVCMSGTVRSVQFKEAQNRSLVHIESDQLPIEVRNQILGEIFGMLPDDDEDLPFEMLGEEVDELLMGYEPTETAPEKKDILTHLEGPEDGGDAPAPAPKPGFTKE